MLKEITYIRQKRTHIYAETDLIALTQKLFVATNPLSRRRERQKKNMSKEATYIRQKRTHIYAETDLIRLTQKLFVATNPLSRRRERQKKEHVKRGHIYTPEENTYIRGNRPYQADPEAVRSHEPTFPSQGP